MAKKAAVIMPQTREILAQMGEQIDRKSVV